MPPRRAPHYPVDFTTAPPGSAESVQLLAEDGIKSKGVYYAPAGGGQRTAILLMHPRVDFAHHYTVPMWTAAGFPVLAQNSRFVGNDTAMIHEAIRHDRLSAVTDIPP
jgi:hypothetical protein